MDLETWIKIEGPKRLASSFQKLNLNKEKVERKDFTSFVEEELIQEKKNVKNELKLYDSAFMTIFSKAPGRPDKEPMRPLYMYYQNLRKAISKKAFAPSGAGASRPRKPADSRGSSVGSYIGSDSANNSKVSLSSLGGSEDGKKTKFDTVPFSEEESKSLPPIDLMKKMGLENEKDLK